MPKESFKRARASTSARRRNSNSRKEPVGQYFQDAWSLARRTATGLNEIRKLINVEMKYIDSYSILTPTYTGLPVYLHPIAQGDNVSDREGDSIKVQSLEMRGFVQWNDAVDHNIARILVVRDMQNLGALPAASDVLANSGGGSAVVCPYNFINGKEINKRFSVLFDEIVTVCNGTVVVPFSYTTALDRHVYFRGASATVDDAAAGSIYCICLSNQATGGTAPTVNFATRLIYTDN